MYQYKLFLAMGRFGGQRFDTGLPARILDGSLRAMLEVVHEDGFSREP